MRGTAVFTPLELTPLLRRYRGRPLYALRRPLTFTIHLAGFAIDVKTVPEAFVTDLGSVPWPVRLICRPDGSWALPFRWLPCFRHGTPWQRPTVLHDFMCQSRACPRFYTDATFRVAMQAEGVPCWIRVSAFYACRLYAITILPIELWRESRQHRRRERKRGTKQ